MLGYIVPLLPHVFCEQPTPIIYACSNSFSRLEHAHPYTLLNLISSGVSIADDALIIHYKDNEFITQVIDIIGLTEYNEQLEYAITGLCSSNDKLDVTVDIISTLVSYTDIAQLDIDIEDKPHLGHLFKLPISEFKDDEDISNDALQWFLSVYDPNTLYKLLSHRMVYVSKELLQQLLDITIRDHEYLSGHGIRSFMYECIAKQCDISKCKVLLPYVDSYLCALIDYTITGKKYLIDDIHIVRYQDRIWNTDIGKAFFAAHVDSRIRRNVNKLIANDIYYRYLRVLL